MLVILYHLFILESIVETLDMIIKHYDYTETVVDRKAYSIRQKIYIIMNLSSWFNTLPIPRENHPKVCSVLRHIANIVV